MSDLEVGAGTGTNSLWLAERGFDVVGVDLAPAAIEKARAKLTGDVRCRFEVVDVLAGEIPGAPHGAVFDRGCFHVFETPEDQARFASQIANALEPGGRWLSLLGSTEGAPRDTGPPRRNLREITAAVEPALQIVELRRILFDQDDDRPAAEAWRCLSVKREVPAQPPTRWADRA